VCILARVSLQALIRAFRFHTQRKMKLSLLHFQRSWRLLLNFADTVIIQDAQCICLRKLTAHFKSVLFSVTVYFSCCSFSGSTEICNNIMEECGSCKVPVFSTRCQTNAIATAVLSVCVSICLSVTLMVHT